jgi:hypothetical protein
MKDKEIKNESEEIVKEEQEPEASDALPDDIPGALPEAIPDAPTSEDVAMEEKPVLAELEPEPMETDTPKEGKYQI